jgi:hypothetical protein
MDKIAKKLTRADFDSSSTKTEEFIAFTKEFKKDFKKEMQNIGVTDITFSVGHFYISGFFTLNEKTYYFSINDVRCPQENMLYRTAKDKKDYKGGSNMYVKIENGMSNKMYLN